MVIVKGKKVVGIRIVDSMKLCFNWFYYSKPIGDKLELVLNSGDGYIMCERLLVMIGNLEANILLDIVRDVIDLLVWIDSL